MGLINELAHSLIIAESILYISFEDLGLSESITCASETLSKLKMGTAGIGSLTLYCSCKGKLLAIVATESTK